MRFTRLSQHLIERAGLGVHGFITNHSYTHNPTFRGMRWALLSAFDRLGVLDLHGNLKKKEEAPDGSRDENVFDIEQGVAIGLFVKSSQGRARGERVAASRVRHSDLWGSRTGKYSLLLGGGVPRTDWAKVHPRPSFFLLKPFAGDDTAEYGAWASVTEVLPVNSVGIVTARDALTVRWSKREIWGVVREVAEGDEKAVRAKYRLRDVRDWKVAWAQRDLRRSGPSEEKIAPILYRPFDIRYTYYTGASRGFLCYPRADVMGHMLGGRNVGISATRTVELGGFSHIFAARALTQHHTVSLKEVNYLFPLYLHPGVGRFSESLFIPWPKPKSKDGRRPNLDPGFVGRLAQANHLRFVPDGRGDLQATFGPEDVLAYIYAVFHSHGYRERYDAHLKLDFPRVPLPGGARLYKQLTLAGHDLLPLHLLESPALDHPLTDYAGPRAPKVGRVGWSNGTIWLDAANTNARQGHRATRPGQYGFHGVREDVWDFQVGGYQVCHKWLKDRKGRTLSGDDIAHYQKIVVAVSETIVTMTAIDGFIDHFGGWPGAFQAATETAGEPAGPAVAAESRPVYEVGPRTGDSDR